MTWISPEGKRLRWDGTLEAKKIAGGAGTVNNVPVNNKDIVNKEYVDTQITTGVKLNNIQDPDGNGSIDMTNRTQTFSFTNPAGGMAWEFTGNGSGHFLDIKQHTGNVAVGSHLLHIEAADNDAHLLHLTHNGAATSNVLDVDNGGATQFEMDASGKMTWVSDTTLYRSAANMLKTDDDLTTSSFIFESDGDIKCTSANPIDFYPDNQTSIALRVAEDGTNLELSALGTSRIEIGDDVDLASNDLTTWGTVSGAVFAGAGVAAFATSGAATISLGTHVADSTDPHGATLTQTTLVSGGCVFTSGDKSSSAAIECVNVIYGTDATPAANTTPEGTVWLKYTA
jgi:hypothetical protein